MSQWTSVALAWGSAVALLGGYTLVLVRRGRRLSRQVPPDERRWM